MPVIYTYDVVGTLDGFASFENADWGPFWGKGGPELLAHRQAAYDDLELLESRTLDGHTAELVHRPTLHR